MSEGGGREERKRTLSSSPDVVQDKEKLMRNNSPDTLHQSITLLDNIRNAVKGSSQTLPQTPVSHTKILKSPTNLNSDILLKYKSLEMNGKPNKLDCDFLYDILIGLELRVFKQEESLAELKLQLQVKEVEIQTLRVQQPAEAAIPTSDEFHDLKQRLQELENAPLPAVPAATEEDVAMSASHGEFIANAQRELPLLSDGCARAEETILKISDGLKSMEDDMTSFQKSFIKSNRRAHLEGESRDQYSRRETVRVTGVPFKRGENTNNIMCRIAHSIGVRMTESDISVSHRSGRQEPRAIIVKLARRDLKHQILSNRKRTKDIRVDDDGKPVKIFIDEHLTNMRVNMCRKMREDKVPHYTRDGKIFHNHGTPDNEDWKLLDTPTDWENLDIPVSVKEELGIYPKF